MPKTRTTTTSREIRVARSEIEKGIAGVARSMTEIQGALRRVERQIQLDAGARIRALRKEAKGQLTVLRVRRREASRMLGRLSTAAGGSWRDVRKAADRTIRDARSVAASVMGRFQRAVRE